MSVEQFTLTDLSFDALTLALSLAIRNDNALALPLSQIDYQLSVDGQRVLHNTQPADVRISAQDTTRLTLPLKLNWSQLARVVEAAADRTSVMVQVDTTLHVDTPVLGAIPLSIQAQQAVPIPRRPQISLNRFAITELSLTGATLNVDINGYNPNAFAIVIEPARLTLSGNGDTWVDSQIAQQMALAPQTHQQIRIPVRLSFLKLGYGLYRALKSQQPIELHYSGQAQVSTDLPALPPFTLSFDQRTTQSLSLP